MAYFGASSSMPFNSSAQNKLSNQDSVSSVSNFIDLTLNLESPRSDIPTAIPLVDQTHSSATTTTFMLGQFGASHRRVTEMRRIARHRSRTQVTVAARHTTLFHQIISPSQGLVTTTSVTTGLKIENLSSNPSLSPHVDDYLSSNSTSSSHYPLAASTPLYNSNHQPQSPVHSTTSHNNDLLNQYPLLSKYFPGETSHNHHPTTNRSRPHGKGIAVEEDVVRPPMQVPVFRSSAANNPTRGVNRPVHNDSVLINRGRSNWRTHSLPHPKYGPYTCPYCYQVFEASTQYAAHVPSKHYKYQTKQERAARLAARHNKRNFRFVLVDGGSVAGSSSSSSAPIPPPTESTVLAPGIYRVKNEFDPPIPPLIGTVTGKQWRDQLRMEEEEEEEEDEAATTSGQQRPNGV